MGAIFRPLYHFLDHVIALAGIIAGILILLATFMIFYEIVSRSLFNAPTIWSTELSIYAIIGSCFIGAAYALRQEAHIRVDLLLHHVPIKVQKILLITSGILGVIFSVLFTWFSVEHVIQSQQLGFTSSSLLRVPMYIPEMMLPIGGVLLGLAFLLQLTDYVCQEGAGNE